LFVDPKYKGKTSLTSQIDVNILIAGVVGRWKEPLDPTEKEMATAPEIFTKMLENARFIWTDNTQLEQAWAAGDVGLSYIYGSSAKRMKEQGIPVVIVDPVLPWMCGLCLSAESKGKTEQMAYDYINAMLDPKAGAVFTAEYGYGHANLNSVKYGDPAMLKEKGLDDPVTLLAKGIFFDPIPPKKKEKLYAMWHEAQAGLD
jgi:spermidine/putrescine transport system substrate-binding protein